jgi:hypothetical protein
MFPVGERNVVRWTTWEETMPWEATIPLYVTVVDVGRVTVMTREGAVPSVPLVDVTVGVVGVVAGPKNGGWYVPVVPVPPVPVPVPAGVVATRVTTTVLVPDDPHAANTKPATAAPSIAPRSLILRVSLTRSAAPR